jgi:hypothetical protein
VATALLVVVAWTVGGSGLSAAQSESCVPRGSDGKGHRTTRPRAREVVERYARRTMDRCDGVVGMGVGAKTEGNRPAASSEKVHHIAIYLRDPGSKPPNTRSIAGVRIVWVVTGEFTPY